MVAHWKDEVRVAITEACHYRLCARESRHWLIYVTMALAADECSQHPRNQCFQGGKLVVMRAASAISLLPSEDPREGPSHILSIHPHSQLCRSPFRPLVTGGEHEDQILLQD